MANLGGAMQLQLQGRPIKMISIAALICGLGQAFRKAVIEDPKFQTLRKSALAVSRFSIFISAPAQPIGPLCPSPVSRILNADVRMRDARLAPVLTAAVKLGELCLTFGDMFRNGEVAAIGEAVDCADKRCSRLTHSPEVWAQRSSISTTKPETY